MPSRSPSLIARIGWSGPALLALFMYILNGEFTVGWGDSAELAMQADALGVTHPPGYPLHSLLGHAFGYVVPAAAATTWLSIIATVLAVGLIGHRLTAMGGPVAGLAAALAFAGHPLVWPSAIRTEVYNVSAAAVALLLTFLLARRRLSGGAFLVGVALLSFVVTVSPANVLLVPGFAFLMLAASPRAARLSRGLWIAAGLAAAVGLVAAWTIWRSHVEPPLGTSESPTSVGAFVRFATGGDYGVFAGRAPKFVAYRMLANAAAFAGDFLGVGAIAIAFGGWWLWIRDRASAVGLGLLVAGNTGYFILHPWSDYRLMMTPTYLILAMGFGLGLAAFSRRGRVARRVALVAALLLPIGMGLRAQARDHTVRLPGSAAEMSTRLIEVSPPHAVMLADWNDLTPLLYRQRVENQRLDLTILEVTEQSRRYRDLVVPSWRSFVTTHAARPVVTNVNGVAMRLGRRVEPLTGDWVLVYPAAGDSPPPIEAP